MMNINLNKMWNEMNPFERVAVNFLWCEKHNSILRKLDALKAMAARGDGATFTLNELGLSKCAAALTRLRLETKDLCPVKVVGEETFNITGMFYDYKTFTFVEGEKEVSRLIYQLAWTAQEVNEFVEYVADKMRVVMP